MNDFIVTVNNTKHAVNIINDNKVIIDGKEINIELSKVSECLYLLKADNKIYEITTTKQSNEKYNFLLDAHNFESIVRTALKEKAVQYLSSKGNSNHHNKVTAPMPGLIVSLKAKVGDVVKVGDSLLTLEAMKMENDLRSPSSGTVKTVNYNEGDNVEKGSVILIIE